MKTLSPAVYKVQNFFFPINTRLATSMEQTRGERISMMTLKNSEGFGWEYPVNGQATGSLK